MDLSKPLSDEVSEQYVWEVADYLCTSSFGNITMYIKERLKNRSLTSNEKGVVERVIRQIRMRDAALLRKTDSLVFSTDEMSTNRVLVVTAYSDDYCIGRLCEKVNRYYAKRHNYAFFSSVLPISDMIEKISPKKHCAWYKVLVLMKLFADVEFLRRERIQYVMWIDADAIVVDHAHNLDHIIEQAEGRDFIVAEDMNTGCLINSGVYLLRTTRWSQRFLSEVWESDKYDEVFFYEQSAMMHWLRLQKEGFESVRPFHSFLPGAPAGVKKFPHSAVFPTHPFNSNRSIFCDDVIAFQDYVAEIRQCHKEGQPLPITRAQYAMEPLIKPPHSSSHCYRSHGNYCALCRRTVGSNSEWRRSKEATAKALACSAPFIFHPAGMSDKLLMLHTAIYKYSLPYDLISDILLGGDGEYKDNMLSENGDHAEMDGFGNAILADGPLLGTELANMSLSSRQGDATEEMMSQQKEEDGVVGAAAVGTARMRLVRGKMGRVPQSNQTHLLERLQINI